MSSSSVSSNAGRQLLVADVHQHAGLVLALGVCGGSFILGNCQSGPLDNPISVAVYTIFFPEISAFVGLVQPFARGMGIFGCIRRDFSPNDWSFQAVCLFMWLMMMILQLMVQVSCAPGGQFTAAAPSQACVFFGFTFMPAHLDFKMRNTPQVINPSCCGIPADKTADSDTEHHADIELGDD